MRLVTQWFCINCSAIFESETAAATHQFCPRCGEECASHITTQCADEHFVSDPNCPHVCTAAWQVNDLGYLYCSICRKENA